MKIDVERHGTVIFGGLRWFASGGDLLTKTTARESKQKAAMRRREELSLQGVRRFHVDYPFVCDK
jgi:hypothetical protein